MQLPQQRREKLAFNVKQAFCSEQENMLHVWCGLSPVSVEVTAEAGIAEGPK